MVEPWSIKQIYIDSSLNKSENLLIQNILKNTQNKNIKIELIDHPKEIFDFYLKNGNLFEKDTLLVYRHQGKFISSCPGSDGMVCCQYFVINFGIGCLYDCHYCYLQNFMNQPLMTVFGNIEDLFIEIEKKIKGKNFHFRIGTGEYTDSLALDPILEISPILVEYFARLENATLELKTKSNHVENLLGLNHQNHTVVSWSINPQKIIEQIEPGTANLEERLIAAKKVQDAGYKLAFHLDPMIYYDNWEDDYKQLLDQLFDTIDTNRIAWISLGTFRYSIGQKEIMQKRFLNDNLTKVEMVQGSDKKFRYFKTIRQEMYAKIKNYIDKKDPKLFSYLCMETQYMWEKIYQFIPQSSKNLDEYFEKRRLYMENSRLFV
jgi:spore photoproduct lyase